MTRRGGPGPRQRALGLLDAESSDGEQNLPEALRRLCCAVARDVHATGATVTLLPQLGSHTVTAASSDETRRVEELQFDVGEGPTRDAYQGYEPVIVPDLGVAVARWPGYAPVAIAAGIAAVAALPVHVGASRLGALTVYWQARRSPELDDDQDVRVAMVFADVAAELLIDGSSLVGIGLDSALLAGLDAHGQIYQAQGMVMVDLGVPLPEALARMRAQAFAGSQHLAELAHHIIDGRTVVSRDPT